MSYQLKTNFTLQKKENTNKRPALRVPVTRQIQGSSKQKVPPRLEAPTMNVAPEAPSSDPAEIDQEGAQDSDVDLEGIRGKYHIQDFVE